MARPQTNRPRGYHWESNSTRSLTLASLLVFQLVLIVALSILLHISTKNNGILSLASPDAKSTTGDFGLSVPLWASIPSFVFSVFASIWTASAHALRDRQPYADLRRPGGSSLRRTLLLDYRTTFSLFQWITAIKHRHFQVAAALFIAAILSLIVPALSAMLLTAKLVALTEPAALRFTHNYDPFALNASTGPSLIDWKPVIDAASSVAVFNGSHTPWTDSQYAYRRFSLNLLDDHANTSTVQATITGYSAHLDCVVLQEFNREVSRETIKISGVDRGCPFQVTTAAMESALVLSTTIERGCSIAASASRLLFISGRRSDDPAVVLDNISVISCISGYGETNGTLTLKKGVSTATAPDIVSFEPEGETRITSGVNASSWHFEEANMVKVQTFNTNDRWFTSDFGSLVLYHAVSRSTTAAALLNPRTPVVQPSAQELLDSINTVFRLVHVILVSNIFMVPTEGGESLVGEIHSQISRLIIVPWVAYTIIVLLCASVACTAWIWAYVRSHRTILSEEPQGLLSYLGMLNPTLGERQGDEFRRMLDAASKPDASDTSLSARVKEQWNVDEATCGVVSTGRGPLILGITGLKLNTGETAPKSTGQVSGFQTPT